MLGCEPSPERFAYCFFKCPQLIIQTNSNFTVFSLHGVDRTSLPMTFGQRRKLRSGHRPARVLMDYPPAPERSCLYLAHTCEEIGADVSRSVSRKRPALCRVERVLNVMELATPAKVQERYPVRADQAHRLTHRREERIFCLSWSQASRG